jgi:phenylacetate-coenzyme A ligase PaaK-like adenylate-forming protein
MNLQNYIPKGERWDSLLKLFNNPSVYKEDGQTCELFVQALKDMIRWHIRKNPVYAQYLEYFNFKIDDIKTIDDSHKLPFYHANYFKTHSIPSIPVEEAYRHLTSSGTAGQKSQTYFDEFSYHLMEFMLDRCMDSMGAVSDKPTNYVVYSYEPFPGFKTGTANSSVLLTKYAPAKKIVFSMPYDGKEGHDIDIRGCIRALQEYEKEGLPVRVVGFPSFFYFTIQKMKDLGIPPLKLNPESRTSFGGGWKSAADKQIPKYELYALIEEYLGIPRENCRDSFGSVEHFVPYIECKNHNFHLPVWSKLFIRDVKTLEPLPYSQQGFINFVSPYVSCFPGNSVMLGDLGIMHEGKTCGCGINTDYFEIIGRAGTSKNKSCAISAAELLKKHA